MQVVSVSPPDGSQGRPLGQTIQVTFDCEVDQTTVDAGSFLLTQTTLVGVDQLLTKDTISATVVVDGKFSFTLDSNNNSVVTFTPNSPLAQNSKYQVILSTLIKSAGSNPVSLSNIYKWSFDTTASGVVVPPGEPSDIAQVPYKSTWVTPLVGRKEVYLEALTADPPNGSSNLDPSSIETITISFNKNLTVGAVDDDVLVTNPFIINSYPVDGDNTNNPAVGAITATSSITDNVLTINIAANQLNENNILSIIFDDNLLVATDGSKVEEPPLEYFLTTAYNPLYGTARIIRSRFGAFINEVRDDTINLAIYDASRIADAQIPEFVGLQAGITQPFLDRLDFWKKEYAKVCASITVLNNSPAIAFRQKSKLLGDMEITWQQSKIIEKMMDQLYAQKDYLDNYISNLARFPQSAQMAVKGALDWDRPVVGRGVEASIWDPPAANADFSPPYSRRKIAVWWPNYGVSPLRRTI